MVLARHARVVGQEPGRSRPGDAGGSRSALPFGVGQMEKHTRYQRRRDGQIRVVRLPARRGPQRRHPSRDRVLGEPDGQTAAFAQYRVILSPICDTMVSY